VPALVAFVVVVGVCAAGCGGAATRRPSRTAPGGGQHAATHRYAHPTISPCASGASPNEGATFYEQDAQLVIPTTGRSRYAGPLRVRSDRVAGAFAQAAIHYPGAERVSGAGCSPPARGDGLGRPWDCEVSYETSRARSISYRLIISRDGLRWDARPVTSNTSGLGPRLSAGGLTVSHPR